MYEYANETSKPYRKRLIAACIVGGFAGWIVQGMLQGYLVWSLPLFCLAAFGFTVNGDNLIESLVVLLILGVVALILWRVEAVGKRIGPGTLWGAYVSLCVSKLGFALGKAGAFGKDPIS